MQLRILLLTAFSLIISDTLFSQVKLSFHNAQDNRTTLVDSALNIKSVKSIFLFMPLNDGDSLSYQKNAGDLSKRLSNLKVDNIHLYCIWFYGDSKNNSHGLQLIVGPDSTTINELGCMVVNFDTTILNRASKLFRERFKISSKIKSNSIFKISIIDTSCPDGIPARIPIYMDFLKEIVKPNFAPDEVMDMILSSIDLQQTYNARMEAKLDSILDILKMNSAIEKLSKPTKKK